MAGSWRQLAESRLWPIKMLADCKFIIELKAPRNPETIASFYEKIERLLSTTGHVSIASKPFGESMPGFDFSHNLANYLLDRNPRLDILLHVTCYDLNKVNIQSRLTSLQHLKVKRLLIVSGDGYRPSEKPELRALQFGDSHELAERILRDFNWFDSIAVAGYPGGNEQSSFNNQEECRRLSRVLRLGVAEVYTQCVFDVETFAELSRMIRLEFAQVRVVPCVALFKSSSDMNKIARLTRVKGPKVHELRGQLEQMSPEASKTFSFEYLSSLCNRLAAESINLCTFGQFEMAESLLKHLNKSI